VDEVYRALLRSAQKAIADAERQNHRARELVAFTKALQRTAPGELVRCAWCGRVAAGGRWIDPLHLLGTDLRERLRANASHSICPDCFDRVSAEAAEERARRGSP
jgi:hypothetical protein